MRCRASLCDEAVLQPFAGEARVVRRLDRCRPDIAHLSQGRPAVPGRRPPTGCDDTGPGRICRPLSWSYAERAISALAAEVAIRTASPTRTAGSRQEPRPRPDPAPGARPACPGGSVPNQRSQPRSSRCGPLRARSRAARARRPAAGSRGSGQHVRVRGWRLEDSLVQAPDLRASGPTTFGGCRNRDRSSEPVRSLPSNLRLCSQRRPELHEGTPSHLDPLDVGMAEGV